MWYNFIMLDNTTKDFIKKTIFTYLDPKKYRVFVFGSRAGTYHKRYSDIDVGIKGENPVEFKTVARLKDIFEESDIPYTIDLVDFQKVSDRFKSVAEKHIIPL